MPDSYHDHKDTPSLSITVKHNLLLTVLCLFAETAFVTIADFVKQIVDVYDPKGYAGLQMCTVKSIFMVCVENRLPDA